MTKLLSFGQWAALLICFGLVLGVFYYHGSSPRGSTHERSFIVGVNPFAPYVFIEEDESFNGFDIELVREIAAKLGRKLEVKNMSFDALTIELIQGKVDCIIGGLSITKDRQKTMNIIHYSGAGKVSMPLVFWKSLPGRVKDVKDLAYENNRVVCLQPGSLQEDLFSRYSFLELRRLDSVSDMIMEIRYGKAIACALEHEVARSLKKKYPELKTLDVFLPDDLRDYGVGIGFKKSNTSLAQKVGAIIGELKVDGTIKRLEQKWFDGSE